ncbi:MAG: radical SAM protein [bacterium]|nr:radical SAM protein [bacterium]
MTGNAADDHRAPLGHLLAVDGRDYFYDVHTNGLLEVEPVLAAVLPLCGQRSRRFILATLAPRFGVGAVRDALAAIDRGRRERGLFLARRPRLVPPPSQWARTGHCDRDLQHLVLTVTERCNLRCSYCVHGGHLDWVRPHGRASMPEATAQRATRWFLDRADRGQEPVISFYGGEALLEPALIEAVVAAARAHPQGARVRFAVDTNGVLLDDRAIDLLLRERMHLQVSLDGPPGVHDRHRVDIAGHATHAAIEAGLDRLLACDPGAAARIVFNVTMAPPVDVAAVAAYFADFPPFRRRCLARAPLVRVGLADLRGRDWSVPAAARDELERGLAGQEQLFLASMASGRHVDAGPVARALCEPALIRWHHRNRGALGRDWIPGGNCRPGRRKLHVMPDGSLHPCERTGNAMPIGDVASGLDPLMVRALQRRFHRVFAAHCGDCWALRRCHACFATQAATCATGAAATPGGDCDRLRRAEERNLALVVRSLRLSARSRAWLETTTMR